MRNAPPLISIAIISGAALFYEVLLVRLFSIIHWHHFAYMIISLALLGYGASGTFISLFSKKLTENFAKSFVLNAGLFGLAAIACFLFAQQIEFNELEILWTANQWWALFSIYLLLAVPFFFVANCIGLTFYVYKGAIARVYAFDLIGAAFGAVGVIALLFIVPPLKALNLLVALIFLAGAVSCLECRAGFKWAAPFMLGALFFAVLPARFMPPLNITQFKGLEQILKWPDVRILNEKTGPLGVVTVVESPVIPLRIAPGLGLTNTAAIPPQLGVFIDGDGPTAISRYQGKREELRYLDFVTSAAAFHLVKNPSVLILGAGAGERILQASYHHADHIDAVELNPQITELVTDEFAEFAGWKHLQKHSNYHIAEARDYIANNTRQYDIIKLPLMDSPITAGASQYATLENYLFTREALRLFLQNLAPEGLLVVDLWARLPPRDMFKFVTTARATLESLGITEPQKHMAIIRSWRTSTLLVKSQPFTDDDIAAIKTFSADRSFDVVYFPGISELDVNRYNLLDEPLYYNGVQALLGKDADAFAQRYKFDIRPATDNRPYFFQFFKWRSLRELLTLRNKGGMAL
ncbi:MAG: SAM-dependent methyltransferase, partial [Gammaproteobacteria bacterium]|nr:SAM-dependent methyltransferase [Gammaproteobacteria bacterium]